MLYQCAIAFVLLRFCLSFDALLFWVDDFKIDIDLRLAVIWETGFRLSLSERDLGAGAIPSFFLFPRHFDR